MPQPPIFVIYLYTEDDLLKENAPRDCKLFLI